MFLDILVFVSGLFLLVTGAHFVTEYASKLAKTWGVSEYAIGITLVALSTSLPEIAISIISGITSFIEPSTNAINIATGTVIGSNITNIGLILGVSALLMPLGLTKKYIKEEYFMAFLSVFLSIILFIGMDWIGGLILLAIIIGYILYLLSHREHSIVITAEEFYYKITTKRTLIDVILCFIGGIALVIGSTITIKSVLNISSSFGISEFVIALVGISLGTSLPEILASVVAAIKRMRGISIGNIIGSNIFNIIGLSMASLFSPLLTNTMMFIVDIPIMLILSFLIIVFAKTERYISKREGTILLGIYILFILLQTV